MEEEGRPGTDASKPTVGAVRRLTAWATRVAPNLVDPVARRKSRLLGICLLSMTAVFTCVDAAFLLTVPNYQPPWYGYVFLLGTFALNRRGHYQVASPLAIAMFPVVVFGQIIAGTSANALVSLGYLSLSPLLGAIFLSFVGVLVLTAANILGIWVMPLIVPEVVTATDSVGPLSASVIAGALALLYMYHRDQIEKDRQRELRDNEERLRMALDAASMGSWDWNVKEDTAVVSASLEKIFGLEPGQFGNNLDAYLNRIHPEDRDGVQEQLKAALGGASDSIQLTHRLVLPDQSVRWLEVDGRVQRNEAGEPVRMAGTARDVSERRILEDQLRQAQKMDAVGRLAGGIAHDFNNMLTVILVNAELLNNQRTAPELMQIERAATSASHLTRQLLAFSRQAVLRPEVLDLNEVLQTTSQMLQRIIGEDIRIDVRTAPRPCCARVDRAQIEEILLNLATNARDAMPDGGRLLLQTETRTIGAPRARGEPTASGRYVLLSVADTGSGMDEQTRQRVFEPFFTTKEVGKGTGLGMAMVFGIVAQSGGHIHVESKEAEGTTFRLYFPKVDQQAEHEERASVPVGGGSETVLLVEDEHAVRVLCERLLTLQGYEVLVAESAADARKIWTKHKDHIDVLLTDMVMPGESGPALARGLLADRPDLTVLFMSGHAQRVADTTELGQRNFIEKPFTRETLLHRLRAVLEGRAQKKSESA